MATPIITGARLRELLHYEPLTGVFTALIKRSNTKVGVPLGSVSNGYLLIRLDYVLYKAHRLAWLYMTGEWPEHQLDHINGVRSDNRFANLRSVTNAMNCQNQRGPRSNNRSGFLGVCWHMRARKWVAQIQVDGAHHYLGLFETQELAHAAYLEAKRGMHLFGTI